MAPALKARIVTPSPGDLPSEFQARSLRRRTLQAVAALCVLVAIVGLAPGLGEVASVFRTLILAGLRSRRYSRVCPSLRTL